ncbi:hypothetical protein TNCV_3277171 [Trichonephila clavipes]|nr:hypothetical protein TNCV_3277171 [Trichonephila clavipes]
MCTPLSSHSKYVGYLPLKSLLGTRHLTKVFSRCGPGTVDKADRWGIRKDLNHFICYSGTTIKIQFSDHDHLHIKCIPIYEMGMLQNKPSILERLPHEPLAEYVF